MKREQLQGHFVGAPDSEQRFRDFVRQLVARHLEGSDGELEAAEAGPQTDGVIRAGIDKLPGPTVLWVVPPRAPLSRAELARFAGSASRAGFAGVLVVGGDPDLDVVGRFLRPKSPLPGSIPVVRWGFGYLSKLLVDHYAASFVEMFPELLEKAAHQPNAAGDQSPPGRLNEPQRSLRALARAFNKRNLVLVLGAGVSSASKIPTWDDLLRRLLVVTMQRSEGAIPATQQQVETLAKALHQAQAGAPLLEASYLAAILKTDFAPRVRSALYETARDHDANQTLQAVEDLCATGNVRSVITYNFDDLLERRLTVRDVSHRVVTDDRARSWDDEKLCVYHVHGYLPRHDPDANIGDRTLVFAEDAYHTLYHEPYHWANLVQLNALRESVCLFVGMSLTDPNQTRLLRLAANSPTLRRHYALKQRIALSAPPDGVPPNVIEGVLRSYHRHLETTFEALRLSLLWFEEFDEIPELLKRIQTTEQLERR